MTHSTHDDTANNSFLFRSMHMMIAAPSLNTSTNNSKDIKSSEQSHVAREQQQSEGVSQSGRHKEDFPETTPSLRGWKHQNLTVIPGFYFMSPMHRYFPKSDLIQVLERLAKIFQFLSLQTTYHVSPNLAATCVSLDQVELQVTLWGCRKQADNFVLELQRIDGDSLLFSVYARDIIAAAAGESSGTTTTSPQYSSGFSGSSSDGRWESFLARSLPVEERYDDDVASALDFCGNLFRGDRRDARTLALQSCVILTDPQKTMRPVAESVARAILLGETEQGSNVTVARIQKEISSLALTGRWTDTPEDNPEMMAYDKSDAHLALMTMANAVSLLNTQSDFELLLQSAERTLPASSLVQLMQSRIWNCESEPHEAFLATRIMTCLCKAQPDAVRKFVQADCVRSAQLFGHFSHAALEMESGRLLQVLQIDA